MQSNAAARFAARQARAAAAEAAERAALANATREVVSDTTWAERGAAYTNTMRRIETLITLGDGRQRRRVEVRRNDCIISSYEDKA